MKRLLQYTMSENNNIYCLITYWTKPSKQGPFCHGSFVFTHQKNLTKVPRYLSHRLLFYFDALPIDSTITHQKQQSQNSTSDEPHTPSTPCAGTSNPSSHPYKTQQSYWTNSNKTGSSQNVNSPNVNSQNVNS